MSNFEKYIGIPFKHRGRDFNGIDCFGLLCLIFKEERNIIIPDFLDVIYERNWYKEGQNHILNNIGTVDGTFWDVIKKKPYKMYDGLLFFLTSKNIANHIGIYINDNKFIHVAERFETTIDRLDDPFWQSKLYGVMRYRK